MLTETSPTKKPNLTIGLDYDGTITADRAFWLAFYHMAKAAGHAVYVITMRRDNEPINDWPGLIYYTSRKAKKPWCDENRIHIDIWIDDKPEWLTNDSW